MSNTYSLSTSWNARSHTSGIDLVKEIKAIGFDTIELSFALTRPMVDDILSLSVSSQIKVSSLHNMCPLPDEITPDMASPDFYSLASVDQGARRRAVDAAKNTISYAAKFHARAVVLHAGRVEMKDRTRELASTIGDRSRYENLRRDMMKERNIRKEPHIQNLLASLDELVPYSKDMGVALAVETRYYHREIPLIEEFDILFERYAKGDLFYWHDVGHAEVFERLGMVEHKSFLDRFFNRLIGLHLHDIIDFMGDHNAPGIGTFNFETLKPYIHPGIIKVIEVHQPATADDIRAGLNYLNKIFPE